MSVQQKICPKCRTAAELSAQFCVQCGRPYRTKFPGAPDQTVFVSQPPTPPPSAPIFIPVPPAAGPQDNTERSVSMVWMGLGLGAAILCFLGGVRLLTQLLVLRSGEEAIGYSFLYLVFWTWLLSFLTMRFRRLYLAMPDGADPREAHRRRVHFARVAATGGLFLVLVAASQASTVIYDHFQQVARIERLKLAQEEQARQEAIRTAEQRRVDDERRRAELEQRRVELEAARQRSAELRAAAAAARAAEPTAPVAGQVVSSSPLRGYGSYPRTQAATPRLRTRPSSGRRLAWDPNVMPCGHRFSRFLAAMHPGQEIGACDQGHLYRVSGTTWVQAGPEAVRASTRTPAVPPGPVLATAPQPEQMPAIQPLLPCGHPFAQAPTLRTSEGLGGGQEARAQCVRGHRFRTLDGKWVPRN